MDKEIDLINNEIANSTIHLILNKTLWKTFDGKIKSILHSVSVWDEVKFLDETGNLNNEISKVTNNSGGIYLFVAKPNILPGSHFYLMYIGVTRNLRERFRDYHKELKYNKRPKVHRMLKGWGEYLYIRYLPLTEDFEIDKIEAELINKILPPFNDTIPDKKIRDAIKAFSV